MKQAILVRVFERSANLALADEDLSAPEKLHRDFLFELRQELAGLAADGVDSTARLLLAQVDRILKNRC